MTPLPEHDAALLAALPRRDLRPIWQIADGRYGMDRTRPNGETWQLSRTPWWKGPLDDFKRDDVREIVIMAGSQCSKSAGMLMAMAWACAHSPAPMLWITGNDDLAKDASQERVTPTLERCPDTAPLLLNNRLDKTTWSIRMKTCTLHIAGAQSSTSLVQNSYRFVFGDEVCQWPAGSLSKVEKRQRSFGDAKRCFFSTPNLKGDEFHQRFLAGTQNEWVWPCVACNFEQQLTWKALQYGHDNEVNGGPDNAGNSADAQRVGQGSPRSSQEPSLVCQRCGHRHFDEPATRRNIIERGHWQPQNTKATAGIVSYHWNALLPSWVRWADLVDEWKRSRELIKLGNVDALKVFICETLGEPWETNQEIERKSVTLGNYLLGEVQPGGWDFIFLTVDVQQYEFWHVVRGWKRDGTSRLLSCGKLVLWEDIRAKAKQFGLVAPSVTQPKATNLARRVFVDARFNTATVQQETAVHSWTCFMGDDRRGFKHKDGTFKLYSEPAVVDPHVGTGGAGRVMAVRFLFAQPAAQDLLQRLIDAKGPAWEIPADAPQDYVRQLGNEVKTLRRNKATGAEEWFWKRHGANHMRDCEAMQVVAAAMAGILYERPAETPA